MHLEIDLDPIHSERLTALQRKLNKPIPEVLATAIDWALDHKVSGAGFLPEPLSVGEWKKFDLSREFLYDNNDR